MCQILPGYPGLSQLLCHPSVCCLFLAGSSSGAMVQVRNKQGKELALEGNLEAKEKVQVGVSKKEFCGRRKESISWLYCSRDILAVHSQLLKGFSSPSPDPAPGELPGFAGESPGQRSCSAVYKQLCIPKFSRIYNVTAPCESPVLGLNSQTSPSKSRSCHSPRQRATSLR